MLCLFHCIKSNHSASGHPFSTVSESCVRLTNSSIGPSLFGHTVEVGWDITGDSGRIGMPGKIGVCVQLECMYRLEWVYRMEWVYRLEWV